MSRGLKIAPSLLSADFARLGEEVEALTKAGADLIHFDVMVGHFVPNLTVGPCVLRALKPLTSLPFDVHLMVTPVDPHLDAFIEAGADIITVHPEGTYHLQRTLNAIRVKGACAGVALTPAQDPDFLRWVLDDIDMVLIMTVNPGFGGQAFLSSQLEKIARVKAMIGARPIDIEVDGGITRETAPLARQAGANILVAGTSVFQTKDYTGNINALREK